ncbi:MAG: choice-of-anchor H family protein [Pseudomonadota bacterium]|nr:choice-of-anchor H family protein [Pseudomonadota bacterium]
MYKIALIIVTFLLVVLASAPQAQAQAQTQVQPQTASSPDPNSKFRGKIISNPAKPAADLTANALATPTALNTTATTTSVSVYDVWFDLQGDHDGDGYYHQFDVNFDIDTLRSSQRIFVVGELQGEHQQTLFQTEVYTIYGASGNDTYQARVLLTDGYPSDQYTLSLSIHDADTGAELLHYSNTDNPQLADLYLEDSSRENAALHSISIYELAFDLSGDQDRDGYFTDITVEVDADAPGQSRWVYARISLIDPHDHWREINTSQDFRLQDYSSQDRYLSRLSLDYGFDPARYQLAVQLYDADSGNLLITTTSPLATPLHMESQDWDNDAYSVVVEEEYYSAASGGSVGLFFLLMLGLLLLVGRWRKSSK